jgi:hypothetical protein
MGKEKSEVISFRVSPETFRKLKEYADTHGESVSVVTRKVVEEFAAGSPAAPSLGLAAQVPREILELPGAVKRLEDQVAELRGNILGLAEKLDECVGKPSKPPASHMHGVVAGIGIAEALLQKGGGLPKKTVALPDQARAQAEALASKNGRRRPGGKGER